MEARNKFDKCLMYMLINGATVFMQLHNESLGVCSIVCREINEILVNATFGSIVNATGHPAKDACTR